MYIFSLDLNLLIIENSNSKQGYQINEIIKNGDKYGLFAAKLIKYPDLPRVFFEEAKMTTMARSFYSDNKRVKNDIIKR